VSTRPDIGEQEHLVLRAVWDNGPCTVRQIHEKVCEPRGLAYTTTATMLDRLCKKGLVTCDRDGRTLVYRSAGRENVVERERVRSLVDRILGADPGPAVAHLVDAVEKIDPDLLDRLSREVAARKRSRRGS